MAGTITPVRYERGGVTLPITIPGIGEVGVSLLSDQALTLVSSILTVLGRTSITNNPDGTWTVR